MEFNADARLDAKLEGFQYNDDELMLIRVPAYHLGYYLNSASFDRAVGQIDINGIQYNFVKRRLYHDTLEMLCIRNQDMTHLKKAKNEFFKLTNDLQQESQNKKGGSQSGAAKIFSSDLFNLVTSIKLRRPDGQPEKIYVRFTEILTFVNLDTPVNPPEQAT